MFKYFIFEVSLTILFLWIAPSIQNIHDEYSISTTDLETISEICSLALKMSSKPRTLHVANLHQNFPVTPTLLHFHKTSIPTIIIDHPNNLENCVAQSGETNILFILNDCLEILSLVLDFARRKNSKNEENLFQNFHIDNPKLLSAALPRYCVHFKPNSANLPRSDFNKPIDCDFNVTITNHDLKSRSTISDELWNLTRPLYADRIFNSESNLIFFIPENKGNILNLDLRTSESIQHKNESPMCDLLSLFRFSWRIFRGLRTIICPGKRICYRYDPTNGTVVRYNDNAALRFSWPEKRGIKNLILRTYYDDQPRSPLDFVSMCLMINLNEVLLKLRCQLNFDLHYITEGKTKSRQDYSYGLKVDADLVIFGDVAKGVETSDILDFSFPIETGSFCYIAPRRGFLPQYLVPFSSFTITAWVMTALTYVFCILMHHSFKFLARLCFRPYLIEESEAMEIEMQSSFWSIFCYFMCTAQPRLLLGRFYGGKIFFIALVFSTQTLVTVLQGQMVTLVSTGVRLKDITSLEDLEKSQLLVQSTDEDLELIGGRFGLHQMKDKMTDSLQYLRTLLLKTNDFSLSYPWLYSGPEYNGQIYSEDARQILEAISVRTQEDAYFIHFPKRINEKMKKQLLSMSQVTDGSYSMGCIMDYPIYLSFSKYSLYRKAIIDYLLRFGEYGEYDRMGNLQLGATRQLAFFQQDIEESLNLRAYTLADLSTGFICLVCGLSLSFLIFVIELLVQSWF